MRKLMLFLFVLGALAPSTSFGQGKNRISIQTGLFHCFFDGTNIINSYANQSKKTPRNLFGGILNDSRGIQYQRLMYNKFALSVEYTKFSAGYIDFDLSFNSDTPPVLIGKNSKTITINFSRCLNFENNISFQIGGGINYIKGYESLYHWSNITGWHEPHFFSIYKKNLGINLRAGLEYKPVKWLSLFTEIDFIGIVYMKTQDGNGMNTNNFFKEKYGLKNTPSRTDLSLRFGIGFNFGK
jgi:hypothetical protein